MKIKVIVNVVINGISEINLNHNQDLYAAIKERKILVMLGFGRGVRDDGISTLGLGSYDGYNNAILYDTSAGTGSRAPSEITLGIEQSQGSPKDLYTVPYTPDATHIEFEIELPD